MAYNVIPIMDGIWTIEDGTVRMYLVDGGAGALLINTGFGSGDLRELVSTLVKGEITVINTHCHGDHTTGNVQFPGAVFYMGEADAEAIRPACPEGAEIRVVHEGDVVSAGTACVTVLEIPGHTPAASRSWMNSTGSSSARTPWPSTSPSTGRSRARMWRHIWLRCGK